MSSYLEKNSTQINNLRSQFDINLLVEVYNLYKNTFITPTPFFPMLLIHRRPTSLEHRVFLEKSTPLVQQLKKIVGEKWDLLDQHSGSYPPIAYLKHVTSFIDLLKDINMVHSDNSKTVFEYSVHLFASDALKI